LLYNIGYRGSLKKGNYKQESLSKFSSYKGEDVQRKPMNFLEDQLNFTDRVYIDDSGIGYDPSLYAIRHFKTQEQQGKPNRIQFQQQVNQATQGFDDGYGDLNSEVIEYDESIETTKDTKRMDDDEPTHLIPKENNDEPTIGFTLKGFETLSSNEENQIIIYEAPHIPKEFNERHTFQPNPQLYDRLQKIKHTKRITDFLSDDTKERLFQGAKNISKRPPKPSKMSSYATKYKEELQSAFVSASNQEERKPLFEATQSGTLAYHQLPSSQPKVIKEVNKTSNTDLKMFGVGTTRTVKPYVPSLILCKRFQVQPPLNTTLEAPEIMEPKEFTVISAAVPKRGDMPLSLYSAIYDAPFQTPPPLMTNSNQKKRVYNLQTRQTIEQNTNPMPMQPKRNTIKKRRVRFQEEAPPAAKNPLVQEKKNAPHQHTFKPNIKKDRSRVKRAGPATKRRRSFLLSFDGDDEDRPNKKFKS